MAAFIREHAWFLTFWGMIVFFGAIEFLLPQFPQSADRARRWPTNFGLGIVNGLIASSAPALSVGSAQWAADHGVGLFNWIAAPWWIALAGTLLVKSLGQYAFHLFCHKNFAVAAAPRSPLRRASRCFLGVAQPPLEMIAGTLWMIPIVVACGLSPIVLAAYEGVEALVNMLTHANIRIPDAAERYARSLLVTPGLHRLHHSAVQAETDSNYGNVFSFWDRLFGTYRGKATRSGQAFRFGLDDVSRESAGNFGSQLGLPWR